MVKNDYDLTNGPTTAALISWTTDLGRLLLQPVWVSLVLAVHFHLLRPQRHAAVAVEVQPVVSADVRPLLLPIPVLRLQEL